MERESFISQVPDWIGVEELPWKERCQIQLYKLVSLVPVTVTLCLYIYLYIYYVMVSNFCYLSRVFVSADALTYAYSRLVFPSSHDHTRLQ